VCKLLIFHGSLAVSINHTATKPRPYRLNVKYDCTTCTERLQPKHLTTRTLSAEEYWRRRAMDLVAEPGVDAVRGCGGTVGTRWVRHQGQDFYGTFNSRRCAFAGRSWSALGRRFRNRRKDWRQLWRPVPRTTGLACGARCPRGSHEVQTHVILIAVLLKSAGPIGSAPVIKNGSRAAFVVGIYGRLIRQAGLGRGEAQHSERYLAY